MTFLTVLEKKNPKIQVEPHLNNKSIPAQEQQGLQALQYLT